MQYIVCMSVKLDFLVWGKHIHCMLRV